ncbi:MAG: DUF4394 domain-containing protein [Steroidobacteraceae bacterium]
MRKGNLGYWLAYATIAGAIAGCSDSDDRVTQQDTLALVGGNVLVSFNRNALDVKTTTNLTGLASGETLVGIDMRAGGMPAGQLYGLSSAGRIYVIDTGSGAVTLKSTLAADPTDTTDKFTGLSGTRFGVDTNTVPDRMRVVSDTGQDLRINFDTGAVITDGALTLGGAAVGGVTEVAYTNNFSAACRTTLFYLDTTGDRLLTTTDPNNGILTVVGALGVDASAASGFDITTGNDGSNTALAALTVGNATNLYSINLTTGAATSLGAVTGLPSGSSGIMGVAARSPSTTPAQALGELVALTETNKLVSFVNGSPQKLCSTTSVTGLQANESLLGIDLRPSASKIVGLGSAGRLYTIDPATGTATFTFALSPDSADTTAPFTALDGTAFGVDVNPVPDRLRVVSNTGQNLRINMDTGATTTDTTLNPTGPVITDAAYTNSIAGAGSTTLYVLDSAADQLMIQGQPSGNPNSGDLLAVGSLGLAAAGDVQSIGGFDINGRIGTAFAALNVGTATTSDLYNINLTTGAATRVNTIGGGERIRGLTYAAAPAATVLGVTSDNRLVSFKLATPGTLETNVAISGIQGGEKIIGFDVRPANGRFYALTDGGRLYTIDPTTGAATSTSSLMADMTDTTLPFMSLAGTSYGVNFNPVPDRLRVVSDAEVNLRINVDTGATTTDTTLNRGTVAVSAAAYTNSFAGVTAPPTGLGTKLFVIDAQSDHLYLQDPPNNGTLIDVGALGFDVTAVSGFDIVGMDPTGVGLASLAVGTGASALYTINLTTGAATLVGPIGVQPTDRITGIANLPGTAAPAVDSVVFAIANGTSLVTFPRNAPATVSASLPITGLQANETLLGVDFRPANNALYGLGSAGRLYTINPATAAATQVAMLVADAADTTAPFTALLGMNFGVDVNPVADRLRVVSDTGSSLRINMDTGATTTDGDINLLAPDVTAAAYTRSFAGTTATTLYDIDTATATLLRQNPPNDGVLTPVGPLNPADLTVRFAPGGGFDIAGGDDGFALVTLSTTAGGPQSTLYRINLKTGALTSLGLVGPTGTPTITGLAIRLQ